MNVVKKTFLILIIITLMLLIILSTLNLINFPTMPRVLRVYGTDISTGTSTLYYVNTTHWSNATDVYPSSTPLAHALGNTTAGVTVNVTGGQYNETYNIDKNGLYLVSASGASSTIINGTFTIPAGEANVTIDGFKVIYDQEGAGHKHLITLSNGPDNTTIQNCIIDTDGAASQGISIGSAGATNLTVQSNTFYLNSTGEGDIGLTLNPLSTSTITKDIVVTQNVFVRESGSQATNAMKFGALEDASITQNTINRTVVYLCLVDANTDNVTFTGNTWNGGEASSGLIIYESNENTTQDRQLTNLNIYNNTFRDLTSFGILFGVGNTEGNDLDTSTISIYYNNFENITQIIGAYHGAVNNTISSVTINATYNWWGDISGPGGGGIGVAGGAGELVSSSVTYSPWLNSSYPSGSAIRGTGTSDSLTAGNTLNARDVTDTVVETSGTGVVIVGVVKFYTNPVGSSFSGDIEKYIDVNINTTTGVDSLLIKMYYTEGAIDETKNAREHTMYWWNGTSWNKCSNTGINTAENYVWARITDSTTPSLTDLTGTPFGANSLSYPVGGTFPPENRLRLLLLMVVQFVTHWWLMLTALIMLILGIILVLNKREE